MEARSWCLVALFLAACGAEQSDENRGPLQIPRGLGKADSAFSCKGHCGDKAPGCYCDAKCEQYGDCCPDKAKECDGQQGQCTTAADCNGLIHPMCVGQWQCVSDQCSWKCGTLPVGCSSLDQQTCNARTDCEWKTTPGFPGPISMCVEQKNKVCGPILNGQCDAGDLCDIKSCGIGATGTCVTQPTPDKCYDYHYLPVSPVCGCDGKTYGNDCLRLAAGTALEHSGACKVDPDLGCTDNADCPADQFCAFKPGECLLPTFNMLQGQCGPRPQACIQLYDPVCGCNGKTYGNACTAAAAGVSVATKGTCDAPNPPNKTYCNGLCGGQSLQGCYCDSQCSKFGDCCPDVNLFCPTK